MMCPRAAFLTKIIWSFFQKSEEIVTLTDHGNHPKKRQGWNMGTCRDVAVIQNRWSPINLFGGNLWLYTIGIQWNLDIFFWKIQPMTFWSFGRFGPILTYFE